MELRRALVLFAIVLGLAAVVSIVTQPVERKRERTTAAEQAPPPVTTVPDTNPTAEPRPDPGIAVAEIGPKQKQAKVKTDTATTLVVDVEEPGQVGIEGLGLTATGEPTTPARFDLLIDAPGSFRVLFVPAAGGEPRAIGRIDAVSTR